MAASARLAAVPIEPRLRRAGRVAGQQAGKSAASETDNCVSAEYECGGRDGGATWKRE